MLYMLPCMHILGLYRIPNFCNFPYSALKHHLHNTKSYFEQGLTKGINLRNTYASIFRAFHLSWKVLLYLFCLLGLSTFLLESPLDMLLFIIIIFFPPKKKFTLWYVLKNFDDHSIRHLEKWSSFTLRTWPSTFYGLIRHFAKNPCYEIFSKTTYTTCMKIDI